MHSVTDFADQLAEPLSRTFARGGTVLIPAFAVGRSQQVTLALRRLMKRGAIPEVPIHIDSPMAVNATQIYSRHMNVRNLDADVFEDGRLTLFPEHVELHRTVQDSMRLNDLDGPRVILSASGMMSGGRVLHHFRRLAPDRKNLVLFAGYQAVGTRARAVLDGAGSVKIFGRHVPVRCDVLSLQGMSGHADRDELLRWVQTAGPPPRVALLVHGEPAAAEALAQRLRGVLGITAITPDHGDAVDLAALVDEAAGAVDAAVAASTEREAIAP
ncbi:MAG: MBL fold metallo-hydrolase RNA specificity domain-containing protein, partial [Acidobacteriota bacterium]